MNVVDFVKPNDFFHKKVGNALEHLNLKIGQDLEHYLVNLLCDFIQPSSFNIDELNLLDTPLAMIYKKALESTPQMQLKIYKRLGDVSLYIAGYFQDSLNRKTVSPSYYISMGASAYQTASKITQIRHNELHFSRVYQNLALEFKNLVSIMTVVAGGKLTHLDDGRIIQLMKTNEQQGPILDFIDEEMPN